MSDSLNRLADQIRTGLPGPDGGLKPFLNELFGDRYGKKYGIPSSLRDAYKLSNADEGKERVPWAGLINPDNETSGPYGGTSVVWFPTVDDGSLIGFGVGTRGLAPDEGILTRPGHRRRIRALRKYLARLGVECWTKPDPSNLGVEVPKTIRSRFPGFEGVFKKYGSEMYCNALVPKDEKKARRVVQAFFDLYAYERGWQVLKDCQSEYDTFHAELRNDLFEAQTTEQVADVLMNRRFVILQGPPGTGKTRLTQQVLAEKFAGRGMTVQFHPSVTYEDFIAGLAPDPSKDGLHFQPKRGWLLEAAELAQKGSTLLVIDEINRADLGKILGEAIYLFEHGEIEKQSGRKITLPHAINGSREFSFPKNLYILGTMNTADRSIAGIDLAIRRRFAFLSVPPQREVIAEHSTPLALEAFDLLTNVFVEHAPEDALALLPGHAYFLSSSEDEAKRRLKSELLPLLDEYLKEGYLGSATGELYAVRDLIEDKVG